ncbi:MAG TPA: hypothetical protein VKN64_04440 [Halanaerobiales bacterium]|nr:hypothetical protein [Halanaerobiales bacterium]
MPVILDYNNCVQIIDALVLDKGINDIIKEDFVIQGETKKIRFSILSNAIADLQEVIKAGINVMHGVSIIGYQEIEQDGETIIQVITNQVPSTLEEFKSTLLLSLSVDWTQKKRNSYTFETDPVIFENIVNYVADAMVSAYSDEGWTKFQEI